MFKIYVLHACHVLSTCAMILLRLILCEGARHQEPSGGFPGESSKGCSVGNTFDQLKIYWTFVNSIEIWVLWLEPRLRSIWYSLALERTGCLTTLRFLVFELKLCDICNWDAMLSTRGKTSGGEKNPENYSPMCASKKVKRDTPPFPLTWF